MQRKKKVIKMEEFVDIGDKYIGFKWYKITSQFEQYHCEMACYPVAIKLNMVNPYRHIGIDLGLFGLFISVWVGRLG